jgi:hypothetical protein
VPAAATRWQPTACRQRADTRAQSRDWTDAEPHWLKYLFGRECRFTLGRSSALVNHLAEFAKQPSSNVVRDDFRIDRLENVGVLPGSI